MRTYQNHNYHHKTQGVSLSICSLVVDLFYRPPRVVLQDKSCICRGSNRDSQGLSFACSSQVKSLLNEVCMNLVQCNKSNCSLGGDSRTVPLDLELISSSRRRTVLQCKLCPNCNIGSDRLIRISKDVSGTCGNSMVTSL